MGPDNSHVKLGQRVSKKRAEYGWLPTKMIEPDEACVIALSGSDTKDSKKANGFAKMIKEILKDQKMPVYAVEYDLAERNFRVDREAVLARYGQANPELPFIRQVRREDTTYIPQFIRELYQMTIAPRLRDENGNKVSIEKAAQRLNMLVFANHCMGSTVMLQMEHLMADDMKKLGYSEKVQDYLFKQIHAIDIAPVTPFGATKTTTYKFMSFADDRATTVYHQALQYFAKRKKEHVNFIQRIKDKLPMTSEFRKENKPFMMNFSLFRPTSNETVFAVNNIYDLEIQQDEDLDGIEHAFASYSDKEDPDRTKDGDQLSQMFRYTLNWLVEHAKKNQKELTELPNILKEKAFADYITRAMSGRYDVITKEIKLMRERRRENKFGR